MAGVAGSGNPACGHPAGPDPTRVDGLGPVPPGELLPAAMLQDLTGAWQASVQVDTDLAR